MLSVAATGSLHRLLARPSLPPGIERVRLRLPPGAAYAGRGSVWRGALVLVERGALEVECGSGERRTFDAGSLLVLDWLALGTLHNAGVDELVLLAVRRR